MPGEPATPFAVSGPLEANPYLYDCIHRLRFFPSGVVEMLDGAGQLINAHVKGRFALQSGDEHTALIQFFDLVELKLKPSVLVQTTDHGPVAEDYSNVTSVENPDSHNEGPIRALAPMSILMLREEGLFPFVQQVIRKIRDEQEHPCLLYPVRYVFETDPLEPVHDRRAGRPYYQGWIEPDLRYYYCQDDAQHLTAHDLDQRDILPLKQSSQNKGHFDPRERHAIFQVESNHAETCGNHDMDLSPRA
jgi:hypothetical protein